MAFTDRFIEFPIKVFNKKEQELTGRAENTDSWMKVNPFEIASYRGSFAEGNPDEELVVIQLKSGDETMVYLSKGEFEQKLNAFNHG